MTIGNLTPLGVGSVFLGNLLTLPIPPFPLSFEIYFYPF